MREREIHQRERERERSRQREMLSTLGKFRLVDIDDLTRYDYRGNAQAVKSDLSVLRTGSALVETRQFFDRREKRLVQVAFLTERGRALVARESEGQVIHEGQRYVSPIHPDGKIKQSREVFHDTAFYPAYQHYAAEIRRAGGSVTRVVLDTELKGSVASLAHQYLGRQKDSRLSSNQRNVIASRLDLKVSRVERAGRAQEKILIPDFRIIYTDIEGREQKRDIEITTSHYKEKGRTEKAAAGFSLYAASGVTIIGAPARGSIWDNYGGVFDR